MTNESDFHQADIERSASSEKVNSAAESQKKFTPAPWTLEHLNWTIYANFDDGPRAIATMGYDKIANAALWENARLIVAAPDLAAALLDLVVNPEKLSAHKNARAALAKAGVNISNEAGSTDVSLIGPTSPPPVTRGIKD
jgi:hypothetical protein